MYRRKRNQILIEIFCNKFYPVPTGHGHTSNWDSETVRADHRGPRTFDPCTHGKSEQTFRRLKETKKENEKEEEESTGKEKGKKAKRNKNIFV